MNSSKAFLRPGTIAERMQCKTVSQTLQSDSKIYSKSGLTAAGKGRRALGQECLWARERRAEAMSARQGHNIVRIYDESKHCDTLIKKTKKLC